MQCLVWDGLSSFEEEIRFAMKTVPSTLFPWEVEAKGEEGTLICPRLKREVPCTKGKESHGISDGASGCGVP